MEERSRENARCRKKKSLKSKTLNILRKIKDDIESIKQEQNDIKIFREHRGALRT